ncbi:unnamed protein product [Cochlearia groenlandica]
MVRKFVLHVLALIPSCYELDLKNNFLPRFFLELVDSVIADVASEYHQTARLWPDHDLEVIEEELRLSVEARAKVAGPSNNLGTNVRCVVDIFGEAHPPGRKARAKVTRSTTAAAKNRFSRSPNQPYCENQLASGSPCYFTGLTLNSLGMSIYRLKMRC